MSKPTTPRKKLRRLQSRDLTVIGTARRMRSLMSLRERRRLWLLTPLLAVNALLQVLGIASVMPFLTLVANPDAVQQQAYLAWAYDFFGFETPLAFTIAVGATILVVVVTTNVFAALTEYGLLRFSWGLNHSLSTRLLRAYLAKPYVFFLDRNSAELAKNILGEVKHTVRSFVVSGMELLARGTVAIAIIGLLVVMDPVLAVATFGFLAAAYGVIYLGVRRNLTDIGDARSEADRERYKAAAEALAGVKEIKLLGKERPFLKRYERPSKVYVRALTRQQVISMLPRYALETIAIGALLVIVLLFLARGQGIATLLPTLGVYALASYRLLPKLQSVFNAMTNLRFSLASVAILHGDLEEAGAPDHVRREEGGPVLPLERSIELKGVTFAYPNATHPVLDGFDLRIEANTSVAFVGTTGAGKSTVVDLLLGLLRPQSGELSIDGVVVDDRNLPAWQRNLGYVPQAIYLADDTVAANIAFGVPHAEIDRAAVEQAARNASIHDFIVDELPAGYDTEIGERGVRLSGGQRQRLGIARALYRDPSVLVLDEATSALDSVTEDHIFDAVRDLGASKTIIMVAHRISTVRDCDVIFLLEHGRIAARGSYADLLRTSPAFRALANVGQATLAEVT